MFTPLATITVGPSHSERTFYIHTGLLTHRSPFFKAALSGPWKESKSKIINLPADDPAVFAAWTQLAYTGRVVLPDKKVTELYAYIARLYVLAEKLMDTAAKNKCVLAMLAEHRQHPRSIPNRRCIEIVWGGSPEGSCMRRLILDMYIQSDVEFEELVRKWSREFLEDMVKGLMRAKRAREGYGVEEDVLSCAAGRYLEKDLERAGKADEELAFLENVEIDWDVCCG
jgi:hypothetical protein